jgi:hypothetical protein
LIGLAVSIFMAQAVAMGAILLTVVIASASFTSPHHLDAGRVAGPHHLALNRELLERLQHWSTCSQQPSDLANSET